MARVEDLSFSELSSFKGLLSDMLTKYENDSMPFRGRRDDELNIEETAKLRDLGLKYQQTAKVVQLINNEIKRRVDEYLE